MARPAPVFRARVTERATLAFDRWRDLRGYLLRLSGERVEVVIRKERSQRTLKQQAYYFGVVVPLIGEALGYDKQECHEVLAMHFLRIEDCPVTGAPRRKRTPDCDTADFSEYVDACIRLGAEHGVIIPAPGEAEVGA